jgi:hypothetical protein
MQAGPAGDLRQGVPVPPEREDRAVLGKTPGQDSFPDPIRPGDLAGLRLRGLQELLLSTFPEGDLAIDDLLTLADAIDQAVVCGDEEEPAEVIHLGETPAGLAEPAGQIGPDRLDDVGRVELGADGGES